MKAIKKPIVLEFRYATEDEDIITLEGTVKAREGDAIMTGTNGEQWPIKRERFEETYNFDLSLGTCSKKSIVVEVQEMHEPFEVKVGWSNQPIQGKAGDFKVEYSPDDFGVVDRNIFFETYSICNEKQ